MNMYSRSRSRVLILLTAILLCCAMIISLADETVDGSAIPDDDDKEKEKLDFPEEKWGTYYDPNNIFCGQYDCYKILGFDYYAYSPDKKEITQSYRSLSKKWHPDKTKDSNAEERFMNINKAYKVLTSNKKRKEYDRLRERPDEYFYKYGSNTVYSYAPKSDTLMVILTLLVVSSGFTWYAQQNRWQQIANRVVKDAVDGLKQGEGGSTESIQIRKKAEEIMKKKKEEGYLPPGAFPIPTSKKAKMKFTKKEMKERENEELRPIITELVKEITDFGAGFHQPTWRDLLVVRMVKWPIYIASEFSWQLKYYSRRLVKAELSAFEKKCLTERAVGPVAWETGDKKTRDQWISQELWIMENLEEWGEMQEVKQLSSKEQKHFNRLKKKEKGSKANKSD